MPRKDGNHGIVKEFLLAMGITAGGAALVAAGAPAIPVAAATALIDRVFAPDSRARLPKFMPNPLNAAIANPSS